MNTTTMTAHTTANIMTLRAAAQASVDSLNEVILSLIGEQVACTDAIKVAAMEVSLCNMESAYNYALGQLEAANALRTEQQLADAHVVICEARYNQLLADNSPYVELARTELKNAYVALRAARSARN